VAAVSTLEELLEAAAVVPHCHEQEACEALDAGRSSRVHDQLVRAGVREMLALLRMDEAMRERRRK
jgi:hypothetical protein